MREDSKAPRAPEFREFADDPEISVVIPTWNRSDLLKSCLASLRRQTVRHRVLVVDNGSTDDTEQLVGSEFPECRYLRLPANLGFARAVNIGIRHAETRLVALLNNDTEADELWIEKASEAARENPEYSFFASRMVNYFQRNLLDSAGDIYLRTGLPLKRGSGLPAGSFPQAAPVLGASAGAAIYRREMFDRIGFLDEDYHMYLEDVEFSLRAQLEGFRCLYVPEAIVYHIEAASDPDRGRDREGVFYSDRRVYWITRNRWQLMVTYQPLRHVPWLAFGWTKSLFFHLLKAGHTKAFLKGVAAGVRMTPIAARKRLSRRGNRTLALHRLCHATQE
jgi:GT2 family glycosyltransferase